MLLRSIGVVSWLFQWVTSGFGERKRTNNITASNRIEGVKEKKRMKLKQKGSENILRKNKSRINVKEKRTEKNIYDIVQRVNVELLRSWIQEIDWRDEIEEG